MKLRILVVALLGTAVALVPVPASAKGPTAVEISGPGLDEPIRLVRDSAISSQMQMLMETLYGPPPTHRAALTQQPRPRYLVAFTMPGPDGDEAMRQQLYPFAEGGPLVRTPPGQTLFGEARASGWQRGHDALDSLFVSLGAPAPAGAELEWLKYEDDEHGLSIAYPPAWQPASSTVAPALVDPVIPLALGTYDFPTDGCGMAPGPALEALGPQDAFVAVYVGTGAVFGKTGFERPPRFGPELPWRTGPRKCVRNVRGTVRTLHFEVGEQRLMVLAGIGREASARRQETVYRILDTLTVASPSSPPAPAG